MKAFSQDTWGIREEQARGRCSKSAAHVTYEETFLPSTFLKAKELSNKEDRNLPNFIQ